MGKNGFQDGRFNEIMELALLHGIYTGIVSVTLWNICNSHTDISESRSIGRFMLPIIIFLYTITTINFSFNWTLGRLILFRSTLSAETFHSQWGPVGILTTGVGTTAVMSTIVADGTMIWRCWMVWGRRWLVILLPILCLASGFSFKIIEITAVENLGFRRVVPLIIYISCIIATTLWCTILIVFRILIVIRALYGADGGLGEYHHVIEILIESSALHSVTLIIYVALEGSNNWASDYFNTLAAITTGIAPTLLVGRVAAGQARPDDSWQGSIISSLRFEAHPQAGSQTSSQESSMTGDTLESDLEPQPERVDESEEISTEKRIQ
ncbi:uncharacterized protein EV420DRAFT_1644147 [Desarmillaria tabescens]|uniref:Uncharacterized protein n=1 Tax=Armillaria tabescens TaxID=1929756 RepID=A0AA39KA52_ARMTA|nr:uncharacterized protein EV420DRAFT_1644147 [Desarmillaria tabescens]KAK0457394.1 hypothetical protein EV420DRAFT_1644147 [Desarmillaria tabescens]